jgi:hypothetical protein
MQAHNKWGTQKGAPPKFLTQARRNAILMTNGVASGQQHALWLGQEPEGACALDPAPPLFVFCAGSFFLLDSLCQQAMQQPGLLLVERWCLIPRRAFV